MFWRKKKTDAAQEPGAQEQGEQFEHHGEQVEQHGEHEQLEPSMRLTGHQIFYLFVLDGIGGMILPAAINFAIAYGMYKSQNIERHPIRLFRLPNTLAGDAAVTIFVQTVVTWIVEAILVSHDLKTGGVRPIGFVPSPRNPYVRRLLLLPAEADARVGRARPFCSFAALVGQVFRSLVLAAASFLVLWPISVGVLTRVGHKRGNDWEFAKKWAPQVFKGILGGALGLLTTPLMAAFWLVRAGWKSEEVGRGGGEGEKDEQGLGAAVAQQPMQHSAADSSKDAKAEDVQPDDAKTTDGKADDSKAAEPESNPSEAAAELESTEAKSGLEHKPQPPSEPVSRQIPIREQTIQEMSEGSIHSAIEQPHTSQEAAAEEVRLEKSPTNQEAPKPVVAMHQGATESIHAHQEAIESIHAHQETTESINTQQQSPKPMHEAATSHDNDAPLPTKNADAPSCASPSPNPSFPAAREIETPLQSSREPESQPAKAQP
ncbi:hypothetical protein CDD82_6952 [Ophiocordyceps australis]|uniref:Uncharacterized protein n=1 Tax=Ophiocordyceps australis TaxID=1399860 RepID=A0A2C5YPQ9_9HYPO|nr:hypothetical protein CDD82_6952 [Ophiocordyceps australis]